ncbi:hypothetical protein RN001_000976 [Aquatica leii]|uniref:TRAF3-interacting protein 1 n=1 Tax=Aquatica leii TaxID=1421715 RepID=A0AAN7QA21_9COLE|nr:hypothetical protein RN001_000976 [Aquatica leii]
MSNEIDSHVIQATQEVLSKHIKKPQLTEKLLRKPPFRFLHDLITNIIRETGFLKGLYSEKDLVSENVKDKEDKIAFLNKLIEATKTITGMDVPVKPSKIIAGFEPHNTNMLLQAIGMALDKKLDSSKYVNDLKSQKKGKNKENVKDLKPRIAKSREKILKEDDKQLKASKSNTNHNLTPKPSDAKLRGKRSSSMDSKNSTDMKLKQKSRITNKHKIVENDNFDNTTKIVQSESKNNLEKEQLMSQNEIIKEDRFHLDTDINTGPTNELLVDSIKPHFPNSNLIMNNSVVDNLVQNDDGNELMSQPKSDKSDSTKKEKLENISKETAIESPRVADKNIFKEIIPPSRPKSAARPSSVRPSSARPGAPRLQKVDTILIKDKEIVSLGKVEVIDEHSTTDFVDEEETVTIEAAPEIELQAAPIDIPTDKGHLVEQILQQINTSDIEPTKSNLNVEWEQAGLRNRNTAIKEVEQLKCAIQELTKMVNPLGKLINYLHEDIEAMHNELDMWDNCIRQTVLEITNQKKIKDESNMPLQTKLNEIEENIFKHQQQIISTYSEIIRNEERIQDLLMK